MNKFEEKIKKEIDTYEIKTSSDSILNRFENQNKTSKSYKTKNKKLFFGISLGSLTMVAASIIMILTIPGILNQNEKPLPNIKPELTKKEDSLVASELSLLTYKLNLNSNISQNLSNTVYLNNTSLFNNSKVEDDDEDDLDNDKEDNEIENDEKVKFETLVDVFELASDSYYFLINEFDNNVKTIVTENFKGFEYKNVTYHNEEKMYYDNTLLYTIYTNYNLKNKDDNEWYFSGLIQENNQYYTINGTKELNQLNNEYEIETNIIKDNILYSVKREIEDGENTYEFEESFISSEELFSYEINFINNDKFSTIEIEKNDSFEFSVEKIDKNNFNLTYESTLIYLNFNGRIKTYTNSLGEIIVIDN